MRILSAAIGAAKRMKLLLYLVAFMYLASYVTGWYLISSGSPVAFEMRQQISQSVLTQQPFTSVIGFLRQGMLIHAILMTFLVNLVMGAFLSTTLPGVVPLIGALGPIGTTLMRGFAIGVTYPEVLAASPFSFLLGIGTMMLELSAYVFSAAAGINIALAPALPSRHGTRSRWTALKMAWIDAAKVFVIVALLLALGAVWEMTLLYFAIPR